MANEESISGGAPQHIAQTLQQLQALDAQIGDLVSRSQQPLPGTGSQYSDDITPALVQQRRLIEDLQKYLAASESERVRSLALQEVAATINSSLELDQVLNQVMDVIVSLTQAERAMLLLIDEESGRLDVQVARNMDRESIEQSDSFQISRSIAGRVAESGDAVVTMNAQEDARFSTEESIISYQLRSILCVPLKIKEEITGVVYADNRIAAGIFDEQDRDLLLAFANQAAVAIENARLFLETRNNLVEITEMKELMDNVFASVDGGVITIDEADRIALFNRAASQILGRPASDVLQRDYREALRLLGLPIDDLVEVVMAGGETLSKELDIHPDGHAGAVTLYLTLSPLRDMEGRTLGVAIVLDDISEEKRLESVRRYLPPTLVDQVRDLDAAQLPQQRMLTVMFADLRGFSAYSEYREPSQLIEVINGYFARIVEAITQHQGFTDKFMGDAVMALFNTPLNPQDDHVLRAVRTAALIRDNLAGYRRGLPEERHLHFGIGVHTGPAVVGNVGSDLRKDYSAIGDAVNLAKRLQEIAKPDQILISQAVQDAAADYVIAETLKPVKVKGRQTAEQIYALTKTVEPA